MGFSVNPNEYNDSQRRPDVRSGDKLLWLIGMKYGTTQRNDPKIDACYVCVADNAAEGSDVGGLVWDTFTLSQAAAWKLQQVSVALGQKSSWDAEDRKEAWEVLSKRPVVATIYTKPKRTGDGTRANVERFKLFGGDITEEMERVVNEGERWYVEWSRKQSHGGSGSGRARASSGGGYGNDDIPF